MAIHSNVICSILARSLYLLDAQSQPEKYLTSPFFEITMRLNF